MCELLAVNANKAVNISMSMHEWVHRGRCQPHGFGIACWTDGRPAIDKMAESLFARRARVLADSEYRHGNTFLCHVRYATTGRMTEANTHPFTATFEDGREFVFAHNGVVNEVKDWRLRHYVPSGQTDSEHAFQWLLEQLSGIAPEEFPAELKKHADRIRSVGKFNFLMSDGQTTYAYADTSLYYLERKGWDPSQVIELNDAGLEFRLGDMKEPAEVATLVATRPLSNERGWTKMLPGSLAVVNGGTIQAVLN